MKNKIFINNFREIKKSFVRFLSLIIISFLGVFTFAGMQSTSPDMKDTIDTYYDQADMYDIKIISNMGLYDKDYDNLIKIDNIKKIEKVKSEDVLWKQNNKEQVINISSTPKDLNKLSIISGRLPDNANEIVVEEDLITKNNMKIGDIITIENDNFKNKNFTIVGVVISTLYINNTTELQKRGTTSIGNGTINYYAFVNEEVFDTEYYSIFYLTLKNTKELQTGNENYQNEIDKAKTELKPIKDASEKERYDEIYKKYNDEIDENEAKAKEELAKGKETLDSSKLQLDSAKRTLDNAKKTLDDSKSKLNSAKKELDGYIKQYNEALSEYGIDDSNIEDDIEQLEDDIEDLTDDLKRTYIIQSKYMEIRTEIYKKQAELTVLQEVKSKKDELNKYIKEYNDGESKYNKSYKEYERNVKKYNNGLSEYQSGLKQYNEEKEKVENEITEARKKLDAVKKPTWYVYDRDDIRDYASYIENSNSIVKLSNVFPVIFYGISILISLLSMERMVENDRREIGILKCLGFTKRKIRTKYLLFALLSTIIGGLLGAILGMKILPKLISDMYWAIFDIPFFKTNYDIKLILFGILFAAICICGATLYSINKVIKEPSVDLLRTKAPLKGKRILLERVKFIWKRIKFSNKITIRNIIRYKKRVIVSIIGITGSTALILIGLALRDSIIDIPSQQYNGILHFDGMAYTKELSDQRYKEIFQDERVIETVRSQMIQATVEKNDVKLMIFEDINQIPLIADLTDITTGEKVFPEEGKVLVSKKLAELCNLKPGDKITFNDIDYNYTFEVSHIVNNRYAHFAYISKETFEKSYHDYNSNIVLFNINNLSKEEHLKFFEDILKNEEIMGIEDTSTQLELVSNDMQIINYVVIILVVLSSLLAFVVLYNLSNINIQERKKEIATLKVLGFYEKEVDNYITKENIIITIIGITLGIILGYFLSGPIIKSVETTLASYLHNISTFSYALTIIISLSFTILVNEAMHFVLKKIDMKDTLKEID